MSDDTGPCWDGRRPLRDARLLQMFQLGLCAQRVTGKRLFPSRHVCDTARKECSDASDTHTHVVIDGPLHLWGPQGLCEIGGVEGDEAFGACDESFA